METEEVIEQAKKLGYKVTTNNKLTKITITRSKAIKCKITYRWASYTIWDPDAHSYVKSNVNYGHYLDNVINIMKACEPRTSNKSQCPYQILKFTKDLKIHNYRNGKVELQFYCITARLIGIYHIDKFGRLKKTKPDSVAAPWFLMECGQYENFYVLYNPDGMWVPCRKTGKNSCRVDNNNEYDKDYLSYLDEMVIKHALKRGLEK